LLDMAKSGQIDPWNLDLTAVADQYLITVQQIKQSDLRVTGKVLLYLAILLRMKSDILTHGAAYWLTGEDTQADALDETGYDMDTDPDDWAPSAVSLQTVLKRRTSIRQNRIRPVTLVDLITELHKIETLEQRQAMKHALNKMENRRSQSVDLGSWTIEEIETLAHEEFVEDTLDAVSDVIDTALDDTTAMDPVTLDFLVAHLGMDRITVFLALLFLCARHDGIQLTQNRFYGPLLISKLLTKPNADTATGDTALK
jgi:segregation and condensation protein A